MNQSEAWKAFIASGSVFDYLNFKNIIKTDDNTKNNENENRRTDPQTTEYR